MRKWLSTLPTETLLQIASDLGYERADRSEAIAHIVEQGLSYRFSVADLKSRYQLTD